MGEKLQPVITKMMLRVNSSHSRGVFKSLTNKESFNFFLNLARFRGNHVVKSLRNAFCFFFIQTDFMASCYGCKSSSWFSSISQPTFTAWKQNKIIKQIESKTVWRSSCNFRPERPIVIFYALVVFAEESSLRMFYGFCHGVDLHVHGSNCWKRWPLK